MTPTSAPAIPWLIRLRWLALVVLLALPLGSSSGAPRGLGAIAFAGSILAMAATNLALSRATRSTRELRRELVGSVLVLDTGLLTGMLLLSGGAVNPGTVVYLVHITFAAVLLGARWAWTLTVLSVAGFGALFLSSPLPAGAHVHGRAAEPLDSHVFGMWVAFAATAALIAHFVSHVAGALAARERELTNLRTIAARHERLAALTTMAAGAAHELATPLSTIAVIARDIGRTGGDAHCPSGDACRADAALIAQEVARCHRVLDALSGRARGRSGENRPFALPASLEQARAALGAEDAARVATSFTGECTFATLPHDELTSVLVALLRNALDASSAPARVELTAMVGAEGLVLRVADTGTGMSPDVLAHADEPFFTTKAPGVGLGLGVFLARTVTEQLGGRFEITSAPGAGTTVTLSFPGAGSAGPRA